MLPFTTIPGGSLNAVLNSATNYGAFAIDSSIVLNGRLNITLNNGYVPTNGTVFTVLTYSNYSGSFASIGLPAAIHWQSIYGSTNFALVAGNMKPQLGTFNLSGNNLVLKGTGGMPGSNCVILASTNLALPLSSWLALTTNTFDSTGQFYFTNHGSPAKSRLFFIFKLP